MSSSAARERFGRLAALEDEHIDLLEGAFLIAQEEYPDLVLDEQIQRVEAIARRCSEHLAGAEDFFHAVWVINRVLFDEMGLRGNVEAFDDPENSYLNRVLDRRTGIPITLSVLYREVAQRCGFHVEGIGLPGHFVVRVTDDWGDTYVDPFHGGSVVTRDDLSRLLHERFGPRARLLEEHLDPVSPRRILTRMLLNLKRIYVRKQDDVRAVLASERIVLLQPDAATERRDRGLLYRRTGRRAEAITDLRWYLNDRPQAIDAPRIRRVLNELLHERAAEG
jgi:regulator of sirC expression with transglutaminase-like and TPR domain